MYETPTAHTSTNGHKEEEVVIGLLRRLRHQLEIARLMNQHNLNDAGVRLVKCAIYATGTDLRDMGRGDNLHKVLIEPRFNPKITYIG
jgi:hypothetical protein